MKWINTGESEADARRLRLSNFLRKYRSIHVIQLINRPNLADFSFFTRFALHSTDRGTGPNMRLGSAIGNQCIPPDFVTSQSTASIVLVP